MKKTSREIKFRAWQKYHKQMLEVLDIGFKDGKVNSVKVKYPEDTIPPIVTYKKNDKKFWLDDDCIKLMEYTGLKDKNGKEIYEGDIVRLYTPYYNENNKVKLEYKVFYFEEGAFFQLENIKDKNDLDTFCGYSNKQFEVIGNIYENPELLEVNKNE